MTGETPVFHLGSQSPAECLYRLTHVQGNFGTFPGLRSPQARKALRWYTMPIRLRTPQISETGAVGPLAEGLQGNRRVAVPLAAFCSEAEPGRSG